MIIPETSNPNQPYASYPNYPTWAMATWFSNHSQANAEALRLLPLCREDAAEETLRFAEQGEDLGEDVYATTELGGNLESWFKEEWLPALAPAQGIVEELMRVGLDMVDWWEVADTISQANPAPSDDEAIAAAMQTGPEWDAAHAAFAREFPRRTGDRS